MAASGVLPDTEIEALIGQGAIGAHRPIEQSQIQPASLDLRLGRSAYRLRASFLPGPASRVTERLDSELVMHKIDLNAGAVLETGCVYLAPLMERLALPPDLHGAANPKSSTGRIDVFTRLIVDGASAFDHVPPAYHGPLWAEICPSTFSILVSPGARLSQLRIRRGPPQIVSETEFSIDLNRAGPDGFRAKRHSGVIDLTKIAAYDPRDFWEPLEARRGRLVLDPGQFYIFASRESVVVPADQAAELAAVRPELGEFRAHYAGFFDPGCGADGVAQRAVLEMRSRDVPFILEHGQPVGKMEFERLTQAAKRLYGEAGQSNYHGQGLKLSKHFATWD